MSDLQVHFETAAQWWAEHFEVEEKRAEFKAALLKRLPENMWNPESAPPDISLVHLDVDYDPEDALLQAINDIGIECSGFMDSAKGLLPMKTRMCVYASGVEVRHGRGGEAQWLSANPPSICGECAGEGGHELEDPYAPAKWVRCLHCDGDRRYFHGHPKWQAPE